ncbi:MAG: Hpt domain-containing protein, partial [Acidobacteria bacterium]|nr:Hpt domain-containing protein [Acidobacteriota bacterium]
MQGIDLSDLVPEFLSEVREHLEALERGLLQLELSGTEEFQKKLINGLFRAAHTIKGSARVMGYDAISRVAHAMEDILDDCRENQKNPNAASIDKLLRAADRLRTLTDQPATSQEGADAMIAELRGGTPAAPSSAPVLEAVTPQAPVPEPPSPELPAPAPSAPPGPPSAPAVASAPAPAPAAEQPSAGPAQEAPAGSETVRVAVSRLDELLRLSGELVMGVQRLEAVQKRRGVLVGGLNRFLQSVVGKEQRLRSGESFSDETASDIVSEAKRFVAEIESFRGETGDVARLLPSITERIEQEVMGLRLYPLSAVFGTLPRLVRDLSKEHGKPVDLVIEGERTELDRRVIQGLSEPLLHIVRNAVDHGLE